MSKETVLRTTARVLPVNGAGEVLLLHGWDPASPRAPYWFSIGGAVEAGESLAEAAARELLEETGIELMAGELGEPVAVERGVEFDWGEWHLVQDQHYFAVALDGVDVNFSRLEPLEASTIDKFGWWTPEGLEIDGTAASETLAGMMRVAVDAVRAALLDEHPPQTP